MRGERGSESTKVMLVMMIMVIVIIVVNNDKPNTVIRKLIVGMYERLS